MAKDFHWSPNPGMRQRAMLPPYRYPDWMTSINYNLFRYGTPRPILQYDSYQQNYRQMWDSQNRRPDLSQERRVEEKFSHRKRGHSPQLRITVNGRQGGSQQAQPQKRKVYPEEDKRIPSGAKRVKRSNNETPSGSGSHSSSSLPTPPSSGKNNPPSDEADLGQTERLSDEIWDYYQEHVQREADYREKEELRQRLEDGIRQVCEGCHLVLVGSSLSGFGCRGSDADFCLLLTLGEVDQRNHARHILQVIHRHLRRFSFVSNSFVIHAKVPIVRFVDKITGLECDININNITGIRNTHLMKAYSKVDWRVAPLVMWIKHWAKANGINDASQGTLSSYSIVLLVLHYLQDVCSPPVIPSLQKLCPRMFNFNKDVFTVRAELSHSSVHRDFPFKSKNTESLGGLLTGFFKHVTSFSFRRYVISVRLASSFQLDNDWRMQYFHIEEPFEQANVARAVHKDNCYQVILRKFKEANKTLNSDTDCCLEDLLSLHTNSQTEELPLKKKKSKRERIKEALNFLKNRERKKKTKE